MSPVSKRIFQLRTIFIGGSIFNGPMAVLVISIHSKKRARRAIRSLPWEDGLFVTRPRREQVKFKMAGDMNT